MIESSIHFLETYVLPLGPIGVFLASIAEEVVAPIPSAIVMMAAGFLFVSGPVDLANILKLVLYVGVPAGLGIALGSLWIYGVAWWGGKAFLDKWGKWLGLYWSDVEKLREKFESSRNDEVAIIAARILPVIPSVAISAFCGFMRMGFWKYFVLTFFGMFLRGVLMGAIGWQVGNVYHKYAETVSKFENVGIYIFAGVVLVGTIVLIIKKTNKN